MSLKIIFSELAAISPLLGWSLKAVLFLIIALLIWIVISLPTGMLFIALHNRLKRAYQICCCIYNSRTETAKGWVIRINEIRDEYCSFIKFSSQPFDRLLQKVNDIKKQTADLNKEIITAIDKLRLSLDRLKKQDHLEFTDFKIPAYNQIEEDQSRRRSAMTMLIVAVPILIALISVNTGMLSKFFEGFIDEYLSYSLGIRLSHVLAFFFSLLEVGLGVFFYYASKHRSSVSLAMPLIQTVVILFIVGLGLIESFLYLSLSAQTANITLAQIQALNGISFIEAVWLTPLGFIIVGVLALVGDMLIKGLDDFRDAGLAKNFKAFLKKIQSDLVALKENLEKILHDIQQSKNNIDSYDAQLVLVQERPVLLQSKIEEALVHFANMMREGFKEYVDNWPVKEARHIFYANAALSIACFVALAVYVVFQGQNLLAVQFLSIPFWINYAVAFILGVAGLLIGYKLYPLISSGSAKSDIGFILRVSFVVLAVLGLCIVLTPAFGRLGYFALLSIQVVLFSVLAFLGRNMDSHNAVFVVMVKMLGCLIIAALIWIMGLLTLSVGALMMLLFYVLYICGLPLLVLLRRQKYLDVEDVADAIS